MKKYLMIIVIFVILLIFAVIPKVELKINNKLKFIRYSSAGDVKIFNESISCYDDGLFYNKKRNITLIKSGYKKILFFYLFEITYKEGNQCDSEFLLTAEVINDLIINGVLIENPNNINLKNMIKDRFAIVKNARYPWPEDYLIFYLVYKYNGKTIPIYVWNENNLIIIQMNNSDEGAKYIAYQ